MKVRPTIRLRLTLLYGGLFLSTSVVLIALIYLLLSHALAPLAPESDQGNQQVGQQVGDQNSVDVQVSAARSDERAAALRAVLTQSSLALLATGGLAVVLGWLVAGRVLRPIREITLHARHASETTLGERIALRGPPDELKELADTFDEMLARLQTAFESQRQFSAHVSHELRTPLAIVRAEAEVALAEPDATPRERRLSETIVAAADRAERLIDGLLALARSESTLRDHTPIDLAELVGDVVNSHARAAATAGVRLALALQPAAVIGDRALLERLVGNLIDNAIKHNQSGGWARVTVGTEGPDAVIHVNNSGARLDPAAVEALFEPFQRGPGRRRARPSGFGLGLAIVRAVATAHGGEVAATAPESGGLAVTVRLPAAHAAPPASRR